MTSSAPAPQIDAAPGLAAGATPGSAAASATAATPDGTGPGRRVLLPLGDLARTVLADGLRAAGWDVDVVVAYRTVPVALPDDVAGLARAGRVDVAVVAAGSAARELARQLGDAAPPVVAIGQPSADAARAAGLTVVGVADHPTDHALADALCAAAHPAPTTRSDA
ncbi:hypothetical protein ET471_04580 [Xylanimonas protaetiae]|uniref:Uroporphyrinogen-III synthase n=2 Tax=Xylanimonas protaetiae TaxID=2509457 RepID=A0A4P6F9W9_9MICO|nr:hypothetical protein ET471_04580 [Xylanimonas protaetiae]